MRELDELATVTGPNANEPSSFGSSVKLRDKDLHKANDCADRAMATPGSRTTSLLPRPSPRTVRLLNSGFGSYDIAYGAIQHTSAPITGKQIEAH